MGAVARPEYEKRMRVGMQEAAGGARQALGREPWVILVGNGACRAAGIKFWHKRPTDHPPPSFEALVTHGNHLLKRYATTTAGGAANGFAYLDRAATMRSRTPGRWPGEVFEAEERQHSSSPAAAACAAATGRRRRLNAVRAARGGVVAASGDVQRAERSAGRSLHTG